MDSSDHDSGPDGGPDGSLDGSLDGAWDLGPDTGGSLEWSSEEAMYWFCRRLDSRSVPAPNGGLSAENLARIDNAGPSQSHNLLDLSHTSSDGRPLQESEQMTIRLRGHRSPSSVVSESGLDRESEQEATGPRGHRSQSI
ncbi:hypothetical protein KVR01_010256 [Diaporthe batatas]|uniref:uncharacterized protein n=1 Tax=Diaporthe batatas TaxID=748121 RepID=UPI001D0478A1|nr:uncharacterized protein KVR01_010256 [Diaporthe batatas]KAG8159619.1 hypothetical protein KVR01_010256 [Diaporthe batatas]